MPEPFDWQEAYQALEEEALDMGIPVTLRGWGLQELRAGIPEEYTTTGWAYFDESIGIHIAQRPNGTWEEATIALAHEIGHFLQAPGVVRHAIFHDAMQGIPEAMEALLLCECDAWQRGLALLGELGIPYQGYRRWRKALQSYGNLGWAELFGDTLEMLEEGV